MRTMLSKGKMTWKEKGPNWETLKNMRNIVRHSTQRVFRNCFRSLMNSNCYSFWTILLINKDFFSDVSDFLIFLIVSDLFWSVWSFWAFWSFWFFCLLWFRLNFYLYWLFWSFWFFWLFWFFWSFWSFCTIRLY